MGLGEMGGHHVFSTLSATTQILDPSQQMYRQRISRYIFRSAHFPLTCSGCDSSYNLSHTMQWADNADRQIRDDSWSPRLKDVAEK